MRGQFKGPHFTQFVKAAKAQAAPLQFIPEVRIEAVAAMIFFNCIVGAVSPLYVAAFRKTQAPALLHKRTSQRFNDWNSRIEIGLSMVRFSNPRDIAGEFDDG